MADLAAPIGSAPGHGRSGRRRPGPPRPLPAGLWRLLRLLAVPFLVALCSLGVASPAQAQQTQVVVASVRVATAVPATATIALRTPSAPPSPSPTPSSTSSPGSVTVDLNPGTTKPSQTVSIILLLTVLSVAPAILMLCTAFTKIIVVLSLARNALGTPTIPPNQVLAGLALFLSLFVMAPVLSQMNEQAVQPYLKGEITQSQAYDRGVVPLKTFMLKQTRKPELATMISLSKSPRPAKPEDVQMTTLVPAFVLSELKSAFIIGFVTFLPFLVIDLVVSSSLMSMGMMMLPPVMIALPFKLLLFVMVDGWDLIAKALVTSYH